MGARHARRIEDELVQRIEEKASVQEPFGKDLVQLDVARAAATSRPWSMVSR